MLNALIDLSHHNRVADFSSVRADGILAVFLKATQGVDFVDPAFRSRRQAALDAGLRAGAYHFGTAGDPVGQAAHFIELAGTGQPLVLDLEDNPQGSTMALTEAERFVHEVWRSSGRYPGLYAGHALKQWLARARITRPEQTALSQCWLWVAQYSRAPVFPSVWPRWTLWQYTDGASGPPPHGVAGIGPCDRDQFNGTRLEFDAFWREQSAPQGRNLIPAGNPGGAAA